MKKIAVISDIHGNKMALDAVLADINLNKCDEIFCLGDIALAGPQPVETMELWNKISPDITVIQGNTDKYLAYFSPEVYKNVYDRFPLMAIAMEDDTKLLPKGDLEYLKSLPEQKMLEIEGVKVLLVHGSPRDQGENILPDLPLEQVEEMVKNTDANLILCGHTHIPCGYQTTSKKTVVNVGSVGRPFNDPRPCYAIITFENGAFTIEHRLVNYDVELAGKILSQRNFEGADKLAQILVNPDKRHL